MIEQPTAKMDERERLAAALAEARAEVERLRKQNAELAEAFRSDPTEDKRDGLRRAAAALAAARDRVDAAAAALAIFERTGSPFGVVATETGVVGCIAVHVKAGSSRAERARAIDDALAADLARAAAELGVVLTAAPGSFTRERPGRDAEGRTLLDVMGRVEGDYLVPAVSKAAKARRT